MFAYRFHCKHISFFYSYYTIATLQWKTVYRTVQVVMNRSPKVYFLLVSSCLQGNYLVGLVRTQRGPQGRPEYHDNMYFTIMASCGTASMARFGSLLLLDLLPFLSRKWVECWQFIARVPELSRDMHCRLQSSQLHGNRLNHYVGEWHRSTSVHNMFNRMIVLDPRYELQNLMIACGLDTCGRLLVMA